LQNFSIIPIYVVFNGCFCNIFMAKLLHFVGGKMKLIVHGSVEEIQEFTKRLPAIIAVEHVSRVYANRYDSSELPNRVYINCDIDFFTCPGCGEDTSSQADFCSVCGLVRSWSDKNIRGLSGVDLKNLLELGVLYLAGERS